MKNGHGAVSIGSENSGGVYHLRVSDCVFEHTDRGLRIKTRRGRGEKAVVEDVCFEHIRMDNVRTPIVVNCYYNCCDPDRHSEYVRCKAPLPVDAGTPSVRGLRFANMECENCHVAAAFVYGLPERKIDRMELENVRFTYAEHPVPMEPAMMDGADENTVRQGLYFNNVHLLKLKSVTVSGCDGEPLTALNVDEIRKE
jgi:polygalacturonase